MAPRYNRMLAKPENKIKALLASFWFCAAWPALGCDAAKAVAEQYGISPVGFSRDIPKAEQPSVKARGWVADVLEGPVVPDGARHTVFIDMATHRAWIHRRGGFVLLDEWYGPVDVVDRRYGKCRAAEGALK